MGVLVFFYWLKYLLLLPVWVATNIYVAQSLDPEGTAMQVVRGVVPFYSCAVIMIVLLVFFPLIALWLPGTMY